MGLLDSESVGVSLRSGGVLYFAIKPCPTFLAVSISTCLANKGELNKQIERKESNNFFIIFMVIKC